MSLIIKFLVVLIAWVIIAKLVTWIFMPQETEEDRNLSNQKAAGIALFPVIAAMLLLGAAQKKLEKVGKDKYGIPFNTDDDDKYLP